MTISSHHATLSRHRRIWRSSLQQTMKAEIVERGVSFMSAIQNDPPQKGKGGPSRVVKFDEALRGTGSCLDTT
jgi:hypothetical protein